MTDESAEILFQLFLREAIVGSSGMGRKIHSLTMSIQHFLVSGTPSVPLCSVCTVTPAPTSWYLVHRQFLPAAFVSLPLRPPPGISYTVSSFLQHLYRYPFAHLLVSRTPSVPSCSVCIVTPSPTSWYLVHRQFLPAPTRRSSSLTTTNLRGPTLLCSDDGSPLRS